MSTDSEVLPGYRDPKEIYNDSFGIVKGIQCIPKVCKKCYGKLERKSLYTDVIMRRKFNPETGKHDGKIFFEDITQNQLILRGDRRDKNHYELWCTKCPTAYEIIITHKLNKTNNRSHKIVQIFE